MGENKLAPDGGKGTLAPNILAPDGGPNKLAPDWSQNKLVPKQDFKNKNLLYFIFNIYIAS